MMRMPQENPQLPGDGFLGWLGRQFGYIRKAAKTDIAPPQRSKTVYRASTIEEKPLPADPNVKLRRTVIDEVIVQENNHGETETQRKP
jgi:hypothetical protein